MSIAMIKVTKTNTNTKVMTNVRDKNMIKHVSPKDMSQGKDMDFLEGLVQGIRVVVNTHRRQTGTSLVCLGMR